MVLFQSGMTRESVDLPSYSSEGWKLEQGVTRVSWRSQSEAERCGDDRCNSDDGNENDADD